MGYLITVSDLPRGQWITSFCVIVSIGYQSFKHSYAECEEEYWGGYIENSAIKIIKR